MARVKKKRPAAAGVSNRSSCKQSSMIPCMRGGQRLGSNESAPPSSSKNRPKHTYSKRPHDYLKRKSPKSPPPLSGHHQVSARARNDGQMAEVRPHCAALPALVLTPSCFTRSASPSPRRRYHQSCAPSPANSHTPRTGHTPQRDFESYALRYLAEKAIRQSKKLAEERNLELLERERHSSSPPPLKTRHKHYYGQRPYGKDRNVLQMVVSTLGKGFDAFRTLMEDGPIGDSARYCKRRIRRLFRPIWCNCLRHTCLGPPADPIQRYVLSRGTAVRDTRARALERMGKSLRVHTPLPSSSHPSTRLSPDGSERELGSEIGGTINNSTHSRSESPTAAAGCVTGCNPPNLDGSGQAYVLPKPQQESKREWSSSTKDLTFSIKPTGKINLSCKISSKDGRHAQGKK